MKKLLFFIALIPLGVWAEGPKYRHKEAPKQLEFENVYQDIRDTKNSIDKSVIYVTRYGAVPDDSTDDLSAIQKALNAATTGQVVDLGGPGIYLISAALVWPSVSSVTLRGYGSIIKLMDAKNTDLLFSSNYPSPGGGQAPRILGVTFDGNKANNTGSGSMVFYGIDNGYMKDVTVRDAEGVGFFLSQASYWVFENCYALDNIASGFCAYNGSHEIYWTNCHARGSSPGFLLQGPEVDGQAVSTGLHINGGSAEDAVVGQSGVQVFAGVHGFSIKGMRIRGNEGRGIDVHSATTTALSSANVGRNKDGVIANNEISNNDADEGIKVWDDGWGGAARGANNIIITNNRIYDDQGSPTQAYGIALQGFADYLIVVGNDLTGNGSGGMAIGSGVNTNGIVHSNIGDSTYYGLPAGAGTGTVDTGTQNRLAYYAATGSTVSQLGAITGSRALASDSSGLPTASAVTDAELGYLSGVTSSIQNQFSAKLSTTGGTMTGDLIIENAAGIRFKETAGANYVFLTSQGSGITTHTLRLPSSQGASGTYPKNDGSGNLTWVNPLANPTLSGTITTPLTASRALITTAASEISTSAVTSTELGYVSGVTSAIQTQLNAKAPTASPTFTGTITTPLTASRAVVTGASNELAASATTSTELGYVSGVTSAIQTQLGNKAPVGASYVTVAGDSDLNNERTITAGTAIGFSDGGANSTLTINNTGVTSITGTSNQVTASAATGGVTLSLPQSIATTSDVTFGTVTSGDDALVGSNTSTSVRMRYLTLANDGTSAIYTTNQPLMFAIIVADNGYAAGVALRGGFGGVGLAFDSNSEFSTTAGTANKTNVYYSGANSRYEIENKTGGSRNYSIFFLTQGT